MDLYTAIFFSALAVLGVLDTLAPARTFPPVRGWRLKGIASFALYFALSVSLPLWWDAWLAPYRLVDATHLGPVTGTLVGVLALEFVSYGWHRALHESPFLWRWFHQMHHSAERVDIWGTFYFHPLDVVGFAFAASLSLVVLVGLSPVATTTATLVVSLLVALGHANLRTPHWLGYLIARPENHALHHERGVHAYNYGDIALWDQLFGTWKNPVRWEAQAGFYEGASTRVPEMLLGRDVERPQLGS